jgi:hypothetical protein
MNKRLRSLAAWTVLVMTAPLLLVVTSSPAAPVGTGYWVNCAGHAVMHSNGRRAHP